MKYRVIVYYYNPKDQGLCSEIVYEGEDINAGIHAELEAKERFGENYHDSYWYGNDPNCKVRKGIWLELLW